MTELEAIKEIEDGICRFCIIDEHCDECEFQKAIDALEAKSEAEGYRKAMKVINANHLTGRCPRCNNKLNRYLGSHCCDRCGQVLDWSEVE